jgi:hypothetical protein
VSTPGLPPTQALASGVIAGAKHRIREVTIPPPAFPPRERPRLTEEQKAEAAGIPPCKLCASLHAGGELACPRLASFRLDRGELVEGTYWRDGEWDASRVVYAEEIAAEAESPA